MYKSMAFMVPDVARAEGTTGIVNADKVAVGAPPISMAITSQVLKACINEPSHL
jgi:Skp family chaperone for outer membrane proteins